MFVSKLDDKYCVFRLFVIVRVHLSVSLWYLDAEGHEHRKNSRCLNSEESEQNKLQAY